MRLLKILIISLIIFLLIGGRSYSISRKSQSENLPKEVFSINWHIQDSLITFYEGLIKQYSSTLEHSFCLPEEIRMYTQWILYARKMIAYQKSLTHQKLSLKEVAAINYKLHINASKEQLKENTLIIKTHLISTKEPLLYKDILLKTERITLTNEDTLYTFSHTLSPDLLQGIGGNYFNLQISIINTHKQTTTKYTYGKSLLIYNTLKENFELPLT